MVNVYREFVFILSGNVYINRMQSISSIKIDKSIENALFISETCLLLQIRLTPSIDLHYYVYKAEQSVI